MVRMVKKEKVPVDNQNYTVTGTNGFRRGSLTREKAIAMARRMQKNWESLGSPVKMNVFYRDGSPVAWKKGNGEEDGDQA